MQKSIQITLIRASGSWWLWRQTSFERWVVPPSFLDEMHRTHHASTKDRPKPLPSVWGEACCLWRVGWFWQQPSVMYFLGGRPKQLDSNLHNGVNVEKNSCSQKLAAGSWIKEHHSVKNEGHNKNDLDQTIKDGRGFGTRPGPHLLIPTPLCCSAAETLQQMQKLLEDPQVLTWF